MHRLDEAIYHEMARVERAHWWFVAKRRIVRSMIDAYVRPEAGRHVAVADIGCGTGALLDELAPTCDVVGLDSSPTAQQICGARGLKVLPCWLPNDIGIPDSSFDVVVMSDVLEHVDEDAESAIAAAAKLRVGGVLITTVPAHPWMWTLHDEVHHHKRRYTRAAFERVMAGTGLKRERLSFYNTGLFPPMIAARVLGKVFPGSARSGAGVPAAPINAVARGVFGFERFLLPRMALPFGASLIGVYRRTA